MGITKACAKYVPHTLTQKLMMLAEVDRYGPVCMFHCRAHGTVGNRNKPTEMVQVAAV